MFLILEFNLNFWSFNRISFFVVPCIYSTSLCGQCSAGKLNITSTPAIVLILDGNLEIGAHAWNNFGNMIHIRHLFSSTAVTNLFSFTRAQGLLSNHLIYVPWAPAHLSVKNFHIPATPFLIVLQHICIKKNYDITI